MATRGETRAWKEAAAAAITQARLAASVQRNTRATSQLSIDRAGSAAAGVDAQEPPRRTTADVVEHERVAFAGRRLHHPDILRAGTHHSERDAIGDVRDEVGGLRRTLVEPHVGFDADRRHRGP